MAGILFAKVVRLVLDVRTGAASDWFHMTLESVRQRGRHGRKHDVLIHGVELRRVELRGGLQWELYNTLRSEEGGHVKGQMGREMDVAHIAYPCCVEASGHAEIVLYSCIRDAY